MKTILLKSAMLIIAIIVISSCKDEKSTSPIIDNNSDLLDTKIVTIDSCEYIQYRASYGYREATHKGNCKFCAERAKKALQK